MCRFSSLLNRDRVEATLFLVSVLALFFGVVQPALAEGGVEEFTPQQSPTTALGNYTWYAHSTGNDLSVAGRNRKVLPYAHAYGAMLVSGAPEQSALSTTASFFRLAQHGSLTDRGRLHGSHSFMNATTHSLILTIQDALWKGDQMNNLSGMGIVPLSEMEQYDTSGGSGDIAKAAGWLLGYAAGLIVNVVEAVGEALSTYENPRATGDWVG